MISIFCVLLSLSFASENVERAEAGGTPQVLPADHKVRQFVEELHALGQRTSLTETSSLNGEGITKSLDHLTHLAFNFIHLGVQSAQRAISGNADISDKCVKVKEYLKDYIQLFNSNGGKLNIAALVALQSAAVAFASVFKHQAVVESIQSLSFERRLGFWIGVGVIRQFLGSQFGLTSALGAAVGAIENGVKGAEAWEYFAIQTAMVIPPAAIPALLTKFSPKFMKALNVLMMKTPVGYYANGVSKIVLTDLGRQNVNAAEQADVDKSIIANHLAPMSGAHGTGFYGPLVNPSVLFCMLAAPMGAAEEFLVGCASATFKDPHKAVTKDMILFNALLAWNAARNTTRDNILPTINLVQGVLTWAILHSMEDPSSQVLILSMILPALLNALTHLYRRRIAAFGQDGYRPLMDE